MFMNLDAIPADKAMYTLAITWPDSGKFYEEMDIILPRTNEVEKILELTKSEIDENYDPGYIVIGIANQSDGYILLDKTSEL